MTDKAFDGVHALRISGQAVTLGQTFSVDPDTDYRITMAAWATDAGEIEVLVDGRSVASLTS